VKRGDSEEEEGVDAAAALPHAVAPVDASSASCGGGERSLHCCGGGEKSKGGDGDAAVTVAHAVKRGDGEEVEDANAVAALPHAVAPVGAPVVYCCGGERSLHCCGGADESKGGDGVEELDGDAAAALPHAVAHV
jgi:hypothetical protein